MCFVSDYDWHAEVVEQSAASGKASVRCDECHILIGVGETIHHIHQRQHEQCQLCQDDVSYDYDPMHDCRGEHDYGQIYDYDRCDSCDKFLQAVEAAEVEAGCSRYEARPSLEGMIGQRGVDRPPSLLRWIDLAVFVLPDASGDDRNAVIAGGGLGPNSLDARRRSALLSDPSAVPVKIGGSGKVKRTYRSPPLPAGHEQPDGLTARKKAIRAGAVTGSDGGPSVRMGHYRLADALRLQGLPEDFLADAPFTVDGK